MVLMTQLFAPPLPAQMVTRERLYRQLDRALQPPARLILLSAPPGYGKSTLMTGWLQARSQPAIWLSLDVAENDPAQFCSLLVTALAPHLPDLSDLLLYLRLPQGVQHASVIGEVINRAVRTSAHDLVIVLDDYHVVTSPAVHALLQLLLTHLPPRWRLAIVTREDPALNLPQLRARRQMIEVRAGDLAFNGEEGAALLGGALRADLADTIVARTEGWAAGLQLAALALAEQPDVDAFVRDFGGSNRFLLDYLASEVVERLPQDLRRFLCRAAVLGRFSAELCAAAFGPSDAADLIARAADANLFLVRLDAQGRWYRLHHLLGEILRVEVEPDEQRAIARRAALWHRDQQRFDEAIVLALTADDPALAGELIQHAALSMAERGRLATVLGWIADLPEATLWSLPELCVYRAWLLVYNGRFREAIEWGAEISARGLVLDGPQSGLLAGIMVWLRSISGQPLDLEALRSARQRIGDRYPYFAPPVLLAIGQAEREAGNFEGALAHFVEGARISDGSVTGLILDNNRAFLLDGLGRRREARQLMEGNVARFNDASGQPGPLAAIPMIPLGIFLADSGELLAALDLLTRAINRVRRLGLYDVLAGPATYQMQTVLADLGRLEEALRLNTDAQLRAQHIGLVTVAEVLAATAAWLQWQQGHREAGRAWVAGHPLSADHAERTDRSIAVILHSHVLAAQGDLQAALSLLQPRLERARRAGQVTLWLREGVQAVLILGSAGQRHEAVVLLRDLVAAAETIDYRQVFRRHRNQLEPLLGAVRDAAPTFVDDLRITAPALTGDARASLVEPLTDREGEIVRLLTAGLSNAEIAERLFLAPSTIKWYLSEVYGKLGVRRRTEAVARARELGLI